jgi:hypothetical protein
VRRIFLSILLAGLLGGVVRARESTGTKDEAVKKEIIKLELEKLAGVQRSMSEHADWLKKHEATDMVRIDETDLSQAQLSSDELRAQLRNGEYKVLTMQQDDHQVFVYANGNTAVVTYRAIGTIELNGKVFDSRHRLTDVWAKQNGEWLRVLSLVIPLE